MPHPPLLLIVGGNRADRAIAAETLDGVGWQIDHADDASAAVTSANNCRYALILIDVQTPAIDGFATAQSIRSDGGASAGTPILALCAPQQIGLADALQAYGMDGHIAKPVTPAALLDIVETWRPETTAARTAKLAAIFGAAEIARLLDGLRVLLEAQLGIDDGPAKDASAHRLAGLAGTLGFADVSRLWLAVSEGDDTAYAEARISARKALAEIDANPIMSEPNQPPDTRR